MVIRLVAISSNNYSRECVLPPWRPEEILLIPAWMEVPGMWDFSVYRKGGNPGIHAGRRSKGATRLNRVCDVTNVSKPRMMMKTVLRGRECMLNVEMKEIRSRHLRDIKVAPPFSTSLSDEPSRIVSDHHVCCHGDPKSPTPHGNGEETGICEEADRGDHANNLHQSEMQPLFSLKKLFINVDDYLKKYFRSKLKSEDNFSRKLTSDSTSLQNVNNNNHVIENSEKCRNSEIVTSLLDQLIMDIIGILK